MQGKLFRVNVLWATVSKASDKSVTKCPEYVKTIIHNLAKVISNFKL